MTEPIVQIEASTHLLVDPEAGLQVTLRIQSRCECAPPNPGCDSSRVHDASSPRSTFFP
jgi:hypothetical protein